MKYVLAIATMLMMTACGDDVTNVFPTVPANASILGLWSATDAASRIPTLDLRAASLNVVADIQTIQDCSIPAGQNDLSGTSPAINGVGKNQYQIDGSASSGLIQFGPLSHPDQLASDVCYTIGQELYSYSVSANVLTLCDDKYSVCSTYTAQ